MITVCQMFNEFESVLNLSTSAIKKAMPSYYGQEIPHAQKAKLYAQQIEYYITFRDVLASSPKLSRIAARDLLEERVNLTGPRYLAVEESLETWMKRKGLDTKPNAYFITETRLIVRQAICIESLIPNPSEVSRFFDDASVFSSYLQSLLEHAQDIASDLEAIELELERLTPSTDLTSEKQNWWIETRNLLGKHKNLIASLASKYANESIEILATPMTLERLIESVHYSNLPWLFYDILLAQGHKGQVTDGPRDGNRDLYTQKENEFYITQVKCHRNPPVSEQMVRSLAETCRTYQCKKGFFVTSFRFAKNAAQGQWAMRDNGENPNEERIAEIELIDRHRLAELSLFYKIGILPSGFIDKEYWSNMKVSGSRRRQMNKAGKEVANYGGTITSLRSTRS